MVNIFNFSSKNQNYDYFTKSKKVIKTIILLFLINVMHFSILIFSCFKRTCFYVNFKEGALRFSNIKNFNFDADSENKRFCF